MAWAAIVSTISLYGVDSPTVTTSVVMTSRINQRLISHRPNHRARRGGPPTVPSAPEHRSRAGRRNALHFRQLPRGGRALRSGCGGSVAAVATATTAKRPRARTCAAVHHRHTALIRNSSA